MRKWALFFSKKQQRPEILGKRVCVVTDYCSHGSRGPLIVLWIFATLINWEIRRTQQELLVTRHWHCSDTHLSTLLHYHGLCCWWCGGGEPNSVVKPPEHLWAFAKFIAVYISCFSIQQESRESTLHTGGSWSLNCFFCTDWVPKSSHIQELNPHLITCNNGTWEQNRKWRRAPGECKCERRLEWC